MTLLHRVLGTSTAVGALLLTGAALPATASAATTATFTGHAFGPNSFWAVNGATGAADVSARNAGFDYPTQCQVVSSTSAPVNWAQTTWEAYVTLRCTAA
ncbi:hypothetical protein ABT095_00820 [Kitasatospora sp. NPDC002227]|uniref:hypothetical protein n=1 Tax=Kitasatospora sp. NPDC002227 TaxID=3154773 RepID=UPI00331EDC4F